MVRKGACERSPQQKKLQGFLTTLLKVGEGGLSSHKKFGGTEQSKWLKELEWP